MNVPSSLFPPTLLSNFSWLYLGKANVRMAVSECCGRCFRELPGWISPSEKRWPPQSGILKLTQDLATCMVCS